jgi:hypothetical protein
MKPTVYFKLGNQQIIAYPNPAHGQVTFALAETEAEKIEINIYNLAGERIARVEEQRPAQTIKWDTSSVAPGIYFYRASITLNGKTKQLDVKKLAIVN